MQKEIKEQYLRTLFPDAIFRICRLNLEGTAMENETSLFSFYMLFFTSLIHLKKQFRSLHR